jgi:hypothetical protein
MKLLSGYCRSKTTFVRVMSLSSAKQFARTFLLAGLASVTHPVPAFALGQCPAEGHSIEAIEKVIQDAPTCQASYDIMDACLFGATGDVPLAIAVIRKCERAFLTRLSRSETHLYQRKRERCRAKYAKMDGTMYISAAATCEATVALRLATKVSGSS